MPTNQSASTAKMLTKLKIIKRKHIIYGVLIVLILLLSVVKLLSISPYNPNGGSVQYFRATVEQVGTTNSQTQDSNQIVQAKLLDGPNKGQGVIVSRSVSFGDNSYKRLPIGSQILLQKDKTDGNQYTFLSRWHLPGIATLFLILLLLVIVIGGWRGITSVFGLVISIGVLSIYVFPRILAGDSAFTACIQGALIITAIAIYVAHGISRRTTVAFISSLIALFVVIGLVGLATYITGTSEVVGDSTFGLIYSSHPIDIAGLLTGGIIIASLGVLYDITTGQAAAVDEIYKADPKQASSKLFKKGLSVGREHIAALVNTLALVYVGVALPSIITTALYNHVPLLINFNNEAVIEEVVRTCVASIGMLIAVPIATGLAAYLLPVWYKKSAEKQSLKTT